MVKILPQLDRPESFGTRIARGLGAGLGEGIPKGIELALEMRDTQAKEAVKRNEKLRSSQAGRYLKDYHPTHIATPEDRNKLIDMASQYTEMGFPWDESLTMAAQQIEGAQGGSEAKAKKMGFANVLGEATKANLGLGSMRSERPAEREIEESRVPGLLHMSQEERKEYRKSHPIRPSKEDRKRGRELAEPDISQRADPLGAAKGIGVGALKNLERFSKDYGLREAVKRDFPEEAAKMGLGPEVSEQLEKKMLEGASEEEQDLIKKRMEIGQLSPVDPEMLIAGTALSGLGKLGVKAFKTKAFKSFWKSAKKLAGREGTSTIKAAEKMAQAAEVEGVNLAKAAAGEVEEAAKLNSLAGRMSTEAPKKVTQMRMNRLSPESRMFKTGEQKKILEAQLKSHPKYAAEIAADAEKRAARLNKPVGEVGKATLERNKAMGEKLLPEAKAAYQRATGRLRALEEEVSKLSKVEQAKLDPLLEAAKTEMKDSETYFSAIASNARHGSKKVGADEMRKAARNKIEKLHDKIAANEKIDWKKIDHHPETIREAERISKKKPLPKKVEDDFYNRVHDTYKKEYQNRLDKIRSEAKALPKTMAGAYQRMHLDKEATELKKLINHAEADSFIHRHKLGLRQMDARKTAQQRLGKTTTKAAKTETSKIADDIINKRKTPKESISENIDKVKKDHPGKAKQFEKEKTSFQKTMEKVKAAEVKAKEKIKGMGQKAKELSEKETVKEAEGFFKNINKIIDEKMSKLPLIGNSIWGKQIIAGVLQGTITSFLQELGYPVAGLPTALSLFVGPGKGMSFIRYGAHGLTTWGLKHIKEGFKINRVARAYEMKDKTAGSKKIRDMRQDYSSKIMKEGLKKYQKSRAA